MTYGGNRPVENQCVGAHQSVCIIRHNACLLSAYLNLCVCVIDCVCVCVYLAHSERLKQVLTHGVRTCSESVAHPHKLKAFV